MGAIDRGNQGRQGSSDVQIGPPVDVDVVVTGRCFTSCVSMTLDVLTTANTIGRALGLPVDAFRRRVLSLDGKPVASTGGLLLPVDGAASTSAGSVVVVCGPGMADTRQVLEDLRDGTNRTLAATLVEARARQAVLCASCSSTFLLAEAGVLNGLGATTSWWLGPTFRARYPTVKLDETRMLVDAGAVVTAGAAFAHADLMLHLVRRFAGPSLAEACARYLTVDDTRRSQAYFRVVEHLAAADPAIVLAQTKIRENPARPPSLAQLARLAGLTPRTLSRRFVAATGLSPARFVRRVQIELAAHLLRSSDDTIESIALQIGYDDERAFRRAFQREIGSPPSRYRKGSPSS